MRIVGSYILQQQKGNQKKVRASRSDSRLPTRKKKKRFIFDRNLLDLIGSLLPAHAVRSFRLRSESEKSEDCSHQKNSFGGEIVELAKMRRAVNVHCSLLAFNHRPPRDDRARSQTGDKKSREDFAGGKGTGGTPLLDFLKPLKEDSRAALLE